MRESFFKLPFLAVRVLEYLNVPLPILDYGDLGKTCTTNPLFSSPTSLEKWENFHKEVVERGRKFLEAKFQRSYSRPSWGDQFQITREAALQASFNSTVGSVIRDIFGSDSLSFGKSKAQSDFVAIMEGREIPLEYKTKETLPPRMADSPVTSLSFSPFSFSFLNILKTVLTIRGSFFFPIVAELVSLFPRYLVTSHTSRTSHAHLSYLFASCLSFFSLILILTILLQLLCS